MVVGKKGHRVDLVLVPQNSNDKSFERKAKDWIEPIINSNSSNCADSFDTVRRMTSYFINNYKSSAVAALERSGKILIAAPMTPTAYVSMLQKASFNATQEKDLTKHLRDNLGNSFCSSKAKIDMLSKGYIPIESRTIEYKYLDQKKEEIIEFNEKDMVVEMESQVE